MFIIPGCCLHQRLLAPPEAEAGIQPEPVHQGAGQGAAGEHHHRVEDDAEEKGGGRQDQGEVLM